MNHENIELDLENEPQNLKVLSIDKIREGFEGTLPNNQDIEALVKLLELDESVDYKSLILFFRNPDANMVRELAKKSPEVVAIEIKAFLQFFTHLLEKIKSIQIDQESKTRIIHLPGGNAVRGILIGDVNPDWEFIDKLNQWRGLTYQHVIDELVSQYETISLFANKLSQIQDMAVFKDMTDFLLTENIINFAQTSDLSRSELIIAALAEFAEIEYIRILVENPDAIETPRYKTNTNNYKERSNRIAELIINARSLEEKIAKVYDDLVEIGMKPNEEELQGLLDADDFEKNEERLQYLLKKYQFLKQLQNLRELITQYSHLLEDSANALDEKSLQNLAAKVMRLLVLQSIPPKSEEANEDEEDEGEVDQLGELVDEFLTGADNGSTAKKLFGQNLTQLIEEIKQFEAELFEE
jgi:hypothetical protein